MNRKLEVIKGNTVTQMAQPYNVIHEGISMFKMAVKKMRWQRRICHIMIFRHW